jgi:F0F1-type ATP synthase assembly protein I
MRWMGTRVTDEAVHREGWDTANTGWIIMSHLLTGILVYAGLGALLSLWLGSAPLLIGGGALLGMFLSLYLIHRRLEATSPGKDQSVPDRATRILRGHRRGAS